MYNKIGYTMSEAARNAQFIETGYKPDAQQTLSIQPEQLSPEQRALLVAYDTLVGLDDSGVVWGQGLLPTADELLEVMSHRLGLITVGIAQLQSSIEQTIAALDALPESCNYREITALAGYEANNVRQSLYAIVERIDIPHAGTNGWQEMAQGHVNDRDPGLLDRLIQARAEAVARHEAHTKAAHDAKRAAEEAERAAKREAERAKEQAAKAIKEQREADKLAWVAAHGSQHLRDCIAAGYDCQTRYLQERRDLEAPGYEIDIKNQCAWKARSCPTPEALAEATRVGGRVVWATKLVEWTSSQYIVFRTSNEVVVIEGWLGQYDLFRMIGEARHGEGDDE
jgi:hypothetical protein